MSAAAWRSCASEDNKTEGGCSARIGPGWTDLEFRTKGQLAIDIRTDAYAGGLAFNFACADEVYGGCTQLREFFESSGRAYVLRAASNFTVTLAIGTKFTCAEAVRWLVKDKRRWEVRSADTGSKGERWYAWARIATASPRHHLPVRRHLKSGEPAFHYCYVPEGRLRPGPVPGPALHRDHPPHRAGHGRAGDLLGHRRAAT